MSRLNDHSGAFCRFVLGGSAFVSWYNAFNEKTSNLAHIAETQDGGFLIWLMGLGGIVILIDLLLNDLTPDVLRFGRHQIRITWRKAFKKRHFVFFALSFSFGAQPFVAEMSGRNLSLFVYFYFWAFVNLAFAFYDARERSRSPGWRKVCN